MHILDAQQTAGALPWLRLINALNEGFKLSCEAPVRHQHSFAINAESEGSLLLMPAWISNQYLGVKQVLVVPDNGKRDLPAVNASYQLSSAKTGELLAMLDGNVLTHRRTAAASALASRYLSREKSEHLLMVGSGGLARSLIPAHATVRPIKQVSIWSRNPERSQALAEQISEMGLSAKHIDDLDHAASNADIISCATLSDEALIKGDSVAPGSHIDLVGAFTSSMRESDSQLISQAQVFVDTYEGALQEAGDLLCAINEGAFNANDIQADLKKLALGLHSGRSSESDITLFKSVGTALEDLYAAILAYESTSQND